MITPDINWAALSPLLVVLGAAVLGVLVEAFASRPARRPVQVFLSLVALATALLTVVWRWTIVKADGPSSVATMPNGGARSVGTFAEDLPALAFQLVILVSALFAIMVIADRTETGEGSFASAAATVPGSMEERESDAAGVVQSEIFPMTLFAVGGMLAFVNAGDLLTLFVALELLSLPLYVLCATARRRRALSQEAALKYFLLGAFASAFFLMGAALLYGFSGSLNYTDIASAVLTATGMDTLLIMGVTMVLVGLLFKVGAAPFHSWTPDAYQGAPTPITGFMAAGTKAAAFAAMLRFVFIIGRGANTELNLVFWIITIATMFVGTLGGIVQRDIKRMLAYSSIAHAGFILIAVNSYSSAAIQSVIFYMIAYGLASIGAFGIVTLVRESDTAGNIYAEATSLAKWKGLGKRNPLLAGCMAVFLLSFAGIPLTGGFMGKFLVFSAGYKAGLGVLVLLAVFASAATAFFYFRLIKIMFFDEPEEGTVTVASEGFSIVAIVVTAVIVVLIGVAPHLVLGFIEQASTFML